MIAGSVCDSSLIYFITANAFLKCIDFADSYHKLAILQMQYYI